MAIPKFKKLSANAQRDFNFYKANSSLKNAPLLQSSVDYEASSLEEAFWLFDTHGIIISGRYLLGLDAMLFAKATINLTIKMWAEDTINELCYQWEVFDWCANDPTWVWEAYSKQVNHYKNFLRFKQIKFWRGIYQVPWMDDFDPVI